MIHPKIAGMMRDAQLALKGGSTEDNFGVFLLGFSYGLGAGAATASAISDIYSGRKFEEPTKPDFFVFLDQIEAKGGFFVSEEEFQASARRMVSAYESAVRSVGEFIANEGPKGEAEAREFRKRIEAAGKAEPEVRRG